ncbi:uncharacterized protein G2W53_029177 [Senna tora]|uniref:Uncharacterized protein n=1 Tax=Senna tora TaxID=362788 RepID=A0A834WBK1_9FABA|nr:uncharacterized protein G2W53_029177 [Senna tora]
MDYKLSFDIIITGVSNRHPNVTLVNDEIKSMQGRDWDLRLPAGSG